ncbi:MAG: ABC transporter permease [Candidatus Delongbacteria bacterium]|jgi:ABC-2 type transport system permease protein|nr:ABC transporter permease [Candidatus Delongbacteria bacterium]
MIFQFRQLIAFVKKEFYHIFRDGRTLLILFGIPVMDVILFGFALTNEVKNAEIAVIDYSRDQYSIEITNKIMSSKYFSSIQYFNKYDDIGTSFKNGSAQIAVIFPEGFANKLDHENKADIQIIADASNINTAIMLTNYTTSIINDYQTEINSSVPMLIQPKVRMIYNPELRSVFVFIPGVMALVLMIVSAMLTSITLAREKELGTMELLMITPLRPITIIIGKVLPYLVLSVINSGIIIGMGMYVFNMPMNGNIFVLLAESTLYAITSLSLGILISTKAETQQTAMFVSLIGLMLPTILLTGFIFPVESLPEILQYVSAAIPATWFIEIIKSIMIKGLGIEYFWKPTLVLIGMTIFFIMLSLKNYKSRM